MNTSIRLAEAHDAPAVIRIWQEGVDSAIGRPALDVDRVEDFFLERISSARPPFGFWVACDDEGVVVGWQALLPFDNNPATRPFLAEASTYVASASARRGVGEALIRHTMDHATAGALQYVLGFISSENPGAQSMVMKCGWNRAGEMPGTSKAPATPGIEIFVFVPVLRGAPAC
ncbi:GNAT family N-acetyltransferase [Lysobacter niastensis]|uniref:GNAT family N-acetyltransferase n=1 Tax=Lysobacter niastensis TaxID=380629 RepID=A0ABS0B4J0_9GAMM|nr:GNAT family N-acetyltransferase [Lysobacter niastensis]MBF6023393.1 GNAT family N-acetyltransferase [Lysobacter niastensis]